MRGTAGGGLPGGDRVAPQPPHGTGGPHGIAPRRSPRSFALPPQRPSCSGGHGHPWGASILWGHSGKRGAAGPQRSPQALRQQLDPNRIFWGTNGGGKLHLGTPGEAGSDTALGQSPPKSPRQPPGPAAWLSWPADVRLPNSCRSRAGPRPCPIAGGGQRGHSAWGARAKDEGTQNQGFARE